MACAFKPTSVDEDEDFKSTSRIPAKKPKTDTASPPGFMASALSGSKSTDASSTATQGNQKEGEDGSVGTQVNTSSGKARATTSTNDYFKGESDEKDGPVLIEAILGNGISNADIQRLRENGIATVDGLMCTPRRKLLDIKGFSDAKVDKLIAVGKQHAPLQFMTATNLHRERSDLLFIGTGSKEVDKILAGGVETGSITEVFGEARSGKTQFCMTLAVRCQLPVDQGGAEGKALVIDTENSYRSERLLQIAEKYNLNPTDVLDNIVIAKAFTTDQQSQFLTMSAALLSESRFAVVIVDSVTNLFRREYVGRGALADRQSQLNSFLGTLHRFCAEYGVAVVICNQVMSQVDSMTAFFGGPQKIPVGGNIMAHSSTTRLALRKGRGEGRIIRVYDSPCLPEAEAIFKIGAKGIEDADEDY